MRTQTDLRSIAPDRMYVYMHDHQARAPDRMYDHQARAHDRMYDHQARAPDRMYDHQAHMELTAVHTLSKTASADCRKVQNAKQNVLSAKK